jgi:Ca-activated chloride channel family protein
MVDKFNVAESRADVSSSLPPERLRSYAFRLSAPPSTGGTAEPNEAPVGDMFFRSTGVNPFIDTREDRLSTFALDVDTGSWSLTRSYLERGTLPPPEAIRVEEFVNAQEYDDPAPRRGDFTLVAEGAPSPFASPGDYRLLRFAVKGRELDALDRKPAVLTFVVDVSGSMEQENRLGLVKQALGLLLDELQPDDRVGLVVYGTRGRVVLEHTSDRGLIRNAIASLYPEGSTNAEEGLLLGYDLAGGAYQTGWNNRVLLCSDGVANVGATGPESILERIGREARRGIELTTVGFGMGNYNDALMEQLADRGDGRYHYVDTLDEARRIFVENLSGTLETIATDAKVQVELDPKAVERWRLLGYENRDVADRDFRNDRVDAGEIGAGHSATALYEIRLAPGARRNDPIGTLRLRWKSVATGSVEEAALTLHVRDLDPSFTEGSDNLRRAAVAAELAEILKQSFYAKEASWRTVGAEAHRLERESARGRATDDLPAMIERATELSGDRIKETEPLP